MKILARMHRLRLLHIVMASALLVVGVGLGAAGRAVFAQSGNVISGCVESGSGLLRIADACRANE